MQQQRALACSWYGAHSLRFMTRHTPPPPLPRPSPAPFFPSHISTQVSSTFTCLCLTVATPAQSIALFRKYTMTHKYSLQSCVSQGLFTCTAGNGWNNYQGAFDGAAGYDPRQMPGYWGHQVSQLCNMCESRSCKLNPSQHTAIFKRNHQPFCGLGFRF